MKRILLSLFAFVLFLSTAPTTILANEVNFETLIVQQEEFTYEMALDSVIEQLTDQNALKLLPIYIEILQKDFEVLNTYSTRAYYSTTFPNGGNIFYSNYMGYGAEVNEMYLSHSETAKHFAGTKLENLAAFIFSLQLKFQFSGFISTLLAVNTWYSSSLKSTVANGSGRIKIVHSADKYDSATVTFHWSNSPNVSYSSGARITGR